MEIQKVEFYLDVHDWDTLGNLQATTNPTMRPIGTAKRYRFTVELPGDENQTMKAEEIK